MQSVFLSSHLWFSYPHFQFRELTASLRNGFFLKLGGVGEGGVGEIVSDLLHLAYSGSVPITIKKFQVIEKSRGTQKTFSVLSGRVNLVNITECSGVKCDKELGKQGYLKFSPNAVLSHFHAFGYAILFARNVSQNLLGVSWGVPLVRIYVKKREVIS